MEGTLIAHCGAEKIKRADLLHLPVPEGSGAILMTKEDESWRCEEESGFARRPSSGRSSKKCIITDTEHFSARPINESDII